MDFSIVVDACRLYEQDDSREVMTEAKLIKMFDPYGFRLLLMDNERIYLIYVFLVSFHLEGVMKLNAILMSIVSDQEPIILNRFWQKFFQLLGSSSYRRKPIRRLCMAGHLHSSLNIVDDLFIS